jgi:hypothetical protein
MNSTLASLFPNASASTVAANPHLVSTSVGSGNKNPVAVNVERKKAKRGVMNKTESEFALMLEAQKRNGEILRAEYEGVTLRWADMRYTPDFVVFYPESPATRSDPLIKLIEIKGSHIWDRDIVRFKGARAYWPEFAFEMHQKTKNGWKRKF